MNGKTGKRAIAAVLAIVALIAFAQPAHAQAPNYRLDRASYVPGDSGTLYVAVVNTGDTPLEIRNLTIYFPWAQVGTDGKWPSGANVTNNLAQWVTLGTQGGSTNSVWTYSTSFTIPSWFAGSFFGTSSRCPSRYDPRYDQSYHGCIYVGVTGQTPGQAPFYDNTNLSVLMALPTYVPVSIVSQWLPIATLVVLVVATAFLGLAWMSLRRSARKA